jgi:ring-1,2-phenylacetyl-CoA epoxidase subunit PaaD
MDPARTQQVLDALDRVEDPEVPITLRDLGVLRDVSTGRGRVEVTLVPTRLACPAREEMARRVRAAVADVAPETEVSVTWDMTAWNPSDVSARGRTVLRTAGFQCALAGPVACPYCGAEDVRRAAEFGGAVCKVPFTCRACGSTFDTLRSVPR